jgi:type III pantothenate kinase
VIAAWHHYHEPCIVVSAGTAVTIDALGRDMETGGGEFLGGYILPGLRLMQQSISDKAPGVQAIEGRLQDYPDNTADALYTGSLSAIAGAVRGLSARLRHDQQALPRVVIAGGDAEAIHELLAQDAALANRLAIADNLVLQGLLILESEIR